LNAGDALIFGKCTYHTANANNSKHYRRKSLQIRLNASPIKDIFPFDDIWYENKTSEPDFFAVSWYGWYYFLQEYDNMTDNFFGGIKYM